MAHTLEENFSKLREAVLLKRPILKKILEKNGHKKLYDYAKDYTSVNLNPPIRRRQNEFLKVFKEEVEKRLGPTVAEEAAEQLKHYYFISTADHHGPIVSPFFVNSNLLTAAPCLECPDPHLKHIIVLACANISVDNHTFPRGLTFHTLIENQMQMQRLAFFSANVRPSMVYTLPAYTTKEIDKMKSTLLSKDAKGEVGHRETERLMKLIDDIYNQPDVLACKNYSDQVTKTNYKLWKQFFAPSNVTPPDLIYLELETMVVRLLTEYHLYKDTVINHILFDPDYEPLVNSYFEGIFGSFSREEESGTYLFWALPKGAKYKLQLWRKGKYLVSKDETYKIELTPENIQRAMEEKELIPGLLLDFITVSFYYGLKCLGGFNQVNYLTYMKNGYIKMNTDLENYRSIEVCARAQTKELCDGLTIAFLEDPKGEMVLATGPDLILYGNENTWGQFLQISQNMTFEEALNPLMPEIYKITYPETEWDKELVNITDEEIIHLTGLDKKIKACAFISSDEPSQK